MYENTSIPASFVDPYETILSSPVRSPQKSNQQSPIYISLDTDPPSSERTNHQTISSCSLAVPSFQRKFPTIFVGILGLIQFLVGFLVFICEFLLLDTAIGFWFGAIYALAGAAILVLVIGTDRERHQTSVVFICQFIALIFTISELVLHSDLYRKKCTIKGNEPTQYWTLSCYILISQMAAAAVVLLSAIIFSMIYIRLTLIAVKQAHGTYNLSNAIHWTRC